MQQRRKKVWVIAAIIACSMAVFFWLMTPETIELQNYTTPIKQSSFQKLIGKLETWTGRRLRRRDNQTLLTITKIVLTPESRNIVETRIKPFPSREVEDVRAVLLDAETTGWIRTLSNQNANELVGQGRLQTDGNAIGNYYSGYTVVLKEGPVELGLDFTALPRRGSMKTDIQFSMRDIEYVVPPDSAGFVKTNLAASGRLQIPHGQGIVILPKQPTSNGEFSLYLVVPEAVITNN